MKAALEDVRDPQRMPDAVFEPSGNRGDRAYWERVLQDLKGLCAGYPTAPAATLMPPGGG